MDVASAARRQSLIGMRNVLAHRGASGLCMAESADHISCQEVVELVTHYLDKALAPDEAALFEQHFDFCDGCAWYVEQIKATAAALGEIREGDISPEAKDRLLSAFRSWRGSRSPTSS